MFFVKESQNIDYIDLWQLKNLLENRVPFVFFDTREVKRDTLSQAELLLQSAKPIEMKKVLLELKEERQTKEQPIVLLCEDGRDSTEIAKNLYKNGYLNVCVIEGGYRGLVEEIQNV